MSSHVEQIKERLSIVDVVSTYIKLEKSGVNYKARCPFHNEKTPSFYVSTERNSYYCFGCGQKGDIFSFVQEFEGVDFMGALKMLASRAGIELKRENSAARTEREREFMAMEYASVFFQKNLWGNGGSEAQRPVLEYLKSRGLTKETVQEWKIGFALPEWRTLLTALKNKKFNEGEMERVGLIKRKDKAEGDSEHRSADALTSNDYYDRFRSRIMFPIFDTSGRVIAFSGRIFNGGENDAKYLNSPETPLFTKSHVLYGLHKAKQALREKDFAILVEGQMDLLMAHQAGSANTVASSGTALTEHHLEIIRRFTNKVVMAFDPDNAGAKAALRGAQMALGIGMEVKIAALPAGKDPADCVRENPELWKESIAKAVHVIEFYIRRIQSMTTDELARTRLLREQVIPLIAGLGSAMEQSHFIALVWKVTSIPEPVIWEDVRKMKASLPAVSAGSSAGSSNGTGASPQNQTAPPRSGSRQEECERKLFSIIIWRERKKGAGDPLVERIRKGIESIVGEDRYKAVRERSDGEEELLVQAEISYEGMAADVLEEEVTELLTNFERDMLKETFAGLMAKLHDAERRGETEQIDDILKQCKTVSERLAKLPRS